MRHSSIAQLVEQSAVNRSVVGSSPTQGAIFIWAYSSAVEPPAHNRLVPGSNPVGPPLNKDDKLP